MSQIKVGDLQIGYSEAGERNGNAPLVFLHGVGSDKSVWNFQVKELSKNRRVVALDYAGYGESDLPASDLTRAEVAAYVLKAFNALKIERAHVCGLSFGGVAALEMLKQNPARLASLVLANTFAKHPQGEQIVERTFDAVEKLSMREFAERRVEKLLMPQTSQAVKETVIETMARISKETFRWASRAVWLADYTDLLSEINCPTLVVCGADDEITPPDLSQDLAENIKGARLEIVENAAHLSNLDQPNEFNSLIEHFISAETRTK